MKNNLFRSIYFFSILTMYKIRVKNFIKNIIYNYMPLLSKWGHK